jgi:signal transduction histidine kinase/CheY-like chemotaxis protein
MSKHISGDRQLPDPVSVPTSDVTPPVLSSHIDALYQFQQQLILARDAESIGQFLLDSVHALNTAAAAALLLHNGNDRFRVVAGYALPAAAFGRELSPLVDPALAAALELQDAHQFVSNAHQHGQDPIFAEHGRRLWLPLRTATGCIGVLILAASADHSFPADRLTTVKLYAGMAAMALANQSCAGELQAAHLRQGSLSRLNASLRNDHRRSQELAGSLANLAAASSRIDDEHELLAFVLDSFRRFVDYDSASIWLQRNEYHGVLVAGNGFSSDIRGSVLYVGPGTIGYRVANSRHVCMIDDVQQEAGWQNVPGSDIVRSWIGVPLINNKQFFGMMAIDKWQPGFFCSRDADIAQAFADHVALALHHKQLQIRAATRAVRLQLLHRISVRLATIQQVPSLFHELARELHETFGYYQVMIARLEDDVIVPHVDYGRILTASGTRSYRRISTGNGLMGWAVRHAETVLCNDVTLDQRYFARSADSSTRSELVVPIKSASGVLGLINIEGNYIGAFDQDDVYLAEALAGQAAVAMEHIARYNELRTAQDRLLRTSRMQALGELASGVAHDFNNLLTGIVGHTQLLLHQEYDEQTVRESLQIIERTAFAGADTVRRLRDFAQINQTATLQPVNIHDLIEECLSITRPRWRDAAQGQGRHIDVQREYALLPPIQGDPPALRDLLTNLILNAIDAMPEGGTLRIRTALDEDHAPRLNAAGSRRMLAISVIDTGIGIPAELHDQVFNPFFTTKGQRGTGMGLALAHSIVQRHNGEIGLHSSPSTGSCFVVRLPLQEPAAMARPSDAQAPKPSQRSLRILIVDDEEMIRHVLYQMLHRRGHRVVSAAGGQEALDYLHRQSFELVCSDLGMPDLSGWDVLRIARQIDPATRTMLITGWGDQIGEHEAHANNIDYVLAKPFDVNELHRLVAILAADMAQS